MNDEKCIKEKSSKIEKLKKKKGPKINNNNQSKNGNYENNESNENLCFSKYYEENKTTNSSYDLMNVININKINEDIMKNNYLCNRTFQGAYSFSEEDCNLNVNINRSLHGNQMQIKNHENICNNDETSYSSNFNSSLIKLINMNCNSFLDTNNYNKSINKQASHDETKSNIEDLNVCVNEKYDKKKDTKIKDKSKTSIENPNDYNEMNNTLDNSCFMNKLKMFQEATYKSREKSIINNFNDNKNTYDKCVFEKPLRKKKKRNSEDKKRNESNNVNNSNKNTNKIFYNININNLNNKNCMNIPTCDIENFSKKNENLLNDNITKNILENMNYLCSLNTCVDKNNGKARILNKKSNVDYVKNIIRDINKLHKVHNNSNNDNNINLKNNNDNMDQLSSIKENNSYINLLNINKYGEENSMKCLYNSDNLYLCSSKINNNSNNCNTSLKEDSVLYQNNDNILSNQGKNENNAKNDIFVLPLKNNIDISEKYVQNINIVSSSNNISEKILNNDEYKKNNSSMNEYEYYKCSFKNYEDNNIDLSKSQINKGKSFNLNQNNYNNENKNSNSNNNINMNNCINNYINDIGYEINDNKKLRNIENDPCLNSCKVINQNKKKNLINIINENNSEINNSENKVCIIKKKVSKHNNETKKSNDIYKDDNSNYSNEKIAYKDIYNNENLTNCFINNYSSYKTPVKKKGNENQDNSLDNVTSVNEIITNICEILQNNTTDNKINKKLENSPSPKLMNINYHDKNNNINKNENKNLKNYMDSIDNKNYHLLYNKDNDKYNYMNNNEKNDNEIFNTLEKQNTDKLKSNDTLLLLKNLSHNDKFSCLKNIQEEQFDYLKRNGEILKNSNFFSDTQIETNIDDPSLYSKKKNQSINFQIEETFNYEIDKTENEEIKENEKVKREKSFNQYEKSEDDNEHKRNKDICNKVSHCIESKKGKRDCINENYQKTKENDNGEMYEEGYEEEDEEDNKEEKENFEKEEEFVEGYFEDIKNSIEEKRNVKRKLNNKECKGKNQKKMMNNTKKNSSKNNCELHKHKKNVHDNFSKNKNHIYIDHYNDISKTIFNLNNPNIDDFTKNKLLEMIKKPFFSDNGKMHIYYEKERKQMQNGKDMKYIKKVTKNGNENLNNLKKNKNILKNYISFFNRDKELKKENSKEFFEQNENMQHIMKKYHEDNFFNNSDYIYKNQGCEELGNNPHEDNENNPNNKRLRANINLSSEKKTKEKIGNQESSNEDFDKYNNNDIKSIEKKKNNNERENFPMNTTKDRSKRNRIKINNNEDNEERRKSIKMENEGDRRINENNENLNTNKSGKEILYNDNDICTQKFSKNEIFNNTQLKDDDSNKKENAIFVNEKQNFPTYLQKSKYQKNYSENEEEKLNIEGEDDEDSNDYIASSIKKYDSDDICNKNFHKKVSKEKKQKMYLCDIMKSDDLKKINDNYFKLHSNLASNLLSTSTSSSYSNDNVKVSLSNYEMRKLSSNSCINKIFLEDELHNNLGMNFLLNKNCSLYDNNKKNVEGKTSVSIDNNSTSNETNINENNNGNGISGEECIIKNKSFLSEMQKNVIKEIQIENKFTHNLVLNNKYVNEECVMNDNKIIEKREVKDKLKNDEILKKSENPFYLKLNENNDLIQHMKNDNLCCNKDILCKNISKKNSQTLKGYDTLKMNANKYYTSNSQLKGRMLFKSKSYSDNDNFLSLHMKRKMSSYSDYKEFDTLHLKKYKLLKNNYTKEKEFLLNRTNSLNINLNKVGDDILKHDIQNSCDNNNNIIKEKKLRHQVTNNNKLQEESFNTQTKNLCKELNENDTIIKDKDDNIENKKEETNETCNVVELTVKNEIDKKVCTLVNCPTHNPQNYTKSMAKKNDSQGDSVILKEENDELKRIPGVYYDKNSQRWFGEHKINGVKCAQSFAVKKHGCEEAKRLAIEWKKARIRGEVWDRFINKKKKNNNNNCLKASKSNRPSVEELRMKYLSMSKNMPKVRGVWFNSTPQRMGWVGQAYKKCKRIERIFSVNKYGFEGARKLAIAFRNSQKPSNEDSDEDSWSKDDKINVKNNEDNLNNYEYKSNFFSSINNIKNNNKIESKDIRINLCRDAILFILQDLETILELNIPLLNKNVNVYKICIKHHLNYLTLIKSEEQIIPYLTVFGDYIQRCILPTDLPYAELYVLIDSLIHNEILPSFDHKQNFCEYSATEDPGIITPSMLL
ncbi:transcription factor with AP2 domain(s), putative [Plasmodium gallinaceum]|uniref:Transcription factor with AP2 domain(S), putative n=1 Tax=Plasmodium gallinaceum TaxID=5849 RepID=A0A1J1H167_PLAGA|nr:transcription factor with AP2 domain(s), putative [Plasmodium gallinaceum]CRG97029.1 transcription factor with AP2 domain(s), putative [Plasmodium gallinaceum]